MQFSAPGHVHVVLHVLLLPGAAEHMQIDWCYPAINWQNKDLNGHGDDRGRKQVAPEIYSAVHACWCIQMAFVLRVGTGFELCVPGCSRLTWVMSVMMHGAGGRKHVGGGRDGFFDGPAHVLTRC
jgi:hypothetical protein